MAKRVLIKVTEEDIRKGVPRAGDRCPIAFSLYRRGCTSVAVCEYEIVVDSRSYSVPTAVSRFIRDFDAGKSVKPISFYLDLPEAK